MACCIYEYISHKQNSKLMRNFQNGIYRVHLNAMIKMYSVLLSVEGRLGRAYIWSLTRQMACFDHLVSKFCLSPRGLCRGPTGPLTIILSMSRYMNVKGIRWDYLTNHLASIWQVKNPKSGHLPVLDGTDFSWCWSSSRPCFNMLCIPNNYLPKRSNRFTL